MHYRAIWISDVHLGTRECEAAQLLAFLERHDCDYLYLVGDVIDFWRLRRAPYWPQVHSDVVRIILAKARAGTIVTLIPGNHDAYLRRFCDFQLGTIMVTREAVHRTADGRLLAVLHGDDFDGVTRYQRWVVRLGHVGCAVLLTLNRWLNRARRRLGLGYWSLSGRLKGMVRPAVGFATAFETAVVREAQRRRLDGVVCGHIHWPGLHAVGPMLYGNAGDWVESCSAIVEHVDGRLELLTPTSTTPGAAASLALVTVEVQ